MDQYQCNLKKRLYTSLKIGIQENFKQRDIVVPSFWPEIVFLQDFSRSRAEPFQPYQLSGVGGSDGRAGRPVKSQTIENSFICYCLYKLLYDEE